MTEAPDPGGRSFVRGARALALVALTGLALAACSDTPLAPDPDAAPDRDAVVSRATPIVPGRVIVKFRNGEMSASLERRFADRVLDLDDRLGIDVLRVAEGRELEMAAELQAREDVVYAEPDFIYTLNAVPNDRYFGYKWGLHNDGTINASTGEVLASTGAVDADIDWLEAYESLAGASFQNVRIAILDSGIQQNHEDLAAKIVGQYDFFDGDGDASDDNGHGSHTAGIAAAIGDNGVGTTGVAWHGEADLLIAKVCGPTFPFGYGCPSSATASAITWAADNGARVMNLSLGGSSGSSAQQDAFQYALTREALAFCATGNDNGAVSYPAAFPECVAVAATDWSDNRASYSNYGPETELAAPGGDDENADGYSFILSSYEGGADAYAFAAGTSMATPMATGLGGLLASLGVATADEVRSIMQSTADDLGPNGRDDAFGYGRINAYAAVQAVDGGGGDPTNNPPTASFTYGCSDLSCDFDGSGSSDPDGDALTSYSWDFGDGAAATGATASHSYAAGGTYTVTLTVSDGSLDDTSSQDVTVTEPSSGGIQLSATGYKNRGRHTIDLSWTGATSTDVDVYLDGSVWATTANGGAYTIATDNRGGGSYVVQVCEAGTTTCSNPVTVTF